jgi:hypothetical protein
MADPIDNSRGDWSKLVSIETFTEIANALNHLIDSCPVGTIMPICTGLTGVPAPDATVWQECNGSEITEQLSALRGQLTPDLRGKYLKGAASLSTSGILGGANEKNLNHSHGGRTLDFHLGPDKRIADDEDDYWEARDHSHAMNADLPTPINFEPVHIRIKLYLKIR